MQFLKYLFLCLFILCLFSCDNKERSYDPDKVLGVDERDSIKKAIIRYISKLPRRAMDSVRFDSVYNDHYQAQLKNHVLQAYHLNENGEHFFLISRIAPSMEEKWVAVGGKMRLNKNYEPLEYEEVFRTWKMKKEHLDSRAPYLFDLMVKGEDLTPYYTAKAGFNYIEFPDENVYFDKSERVWKSKVFRSVEEMVYSSRDSSVEEQ